MEKTFLFELTADQIAVIRELLTTDVAAAKFGGLSYDGNSWEGDACWIELLHTFEKGGINDIKHANGSNYNRELNAFQRHFNKNHVDLDYWSENVASVKAIFNL